MNNYSQNEVLALAEQVKTLSSALVEHLQQSNREVPNTTLSSPSVPEGDKAYDKIRNELNDAATGLLNLVNGPKIQLRKTVCQGNDLAAYQIAFDYDFYHAIPLDGTSSLSSISEKVNLDAGITGRVLRFLITQGYFREVEKDVFAHTKASVAVSEDENLFSAAQYMVSEMLEAASIAGPALKEGVEPFTKRHGTNIWGYYAKDPMKAARFARAMSGITKVDLHMEGLFNGFPWAELGNARVIDIGGASGHVSVRLARAFPNLKFTVQDNDLEMLNGAKKMDLSGIEDRLSFMQYDFFKPQPVVDADVYFMRQVLHNWDDESCVRILKALVPALEKAKPGTPLLINEAVVPKAGTRTRFEEGMMRQIDMHLLLSFSSKQRSEAEFEALLQQADSRFKIAKVHSVGTVGLVEVHLNPVAS